MPINRRKHSDREMPFLDHLEELRWRLVWAIGALAVGTVVGLIVVTKFNLMALLVRPAAPYLGGDQLIYTHPTDAFNVTLDGGVAFGVMLALPVILYQAWAFLSPALYKREKRVVVGVLIAGVLLFLAGAALSFWVVLPLALPWLIGFGSGWLHPMLSVHDYFDFVFSLMFAFGAGFELPMAIVALGALGILSPKTLSHYRRHAFVAVLVVSAIITPGDMVWSTLALAVPLYLLYEASVLVVRMLHRSRARESYPVDVVAQE